MPVQETQRDQTPPQRGNLGVFIEGEERALQAVSAAERGGGEDRRNWGVEDATRSKGHRY